MRTCDHTSKTEESLDWSWRWQKLHYAAQRVSLQLGIYSTFPKSSCYHPETAALFQVILPLVLTPLPCQRSRGECKIVIIGVFTVSWNNGIWKSSRHVSCSSNEQIFQSTLLICKLRWKPAQFVVRMGHGRQNCIIDCWI